MKAKEISTMLKTASLAFSAVRIMNALKKIVVAFAVLLCGLYAIKIRRG